MDSSHELLYLMSTGNDPSTSCKYKKLNKMNFYTVLHIFYNMFEHNWQDYAKLFTKLYTTKHNLINLYRNYTVSKTY